MLQLPGMTFVTEQCDANGNVPGTSEGVVDADGRAKTTTSLILAHYLLWFLRGVPRQRAAGAWGGPDARIVACSGDEKYLFETCPWGQFRDEAKSCRKA